MNNKLKTFKIYHPDLGDLNTDCKLDRVFVEAAEVKAVNLVSVYYRAQNDFNPEYAAFDVRSTCVGDIIEDIEEDKLYICAGLGYKPVRRKDVIILSKEDLFKNEMIESVKKTLDLTDKILDHDDI